MNLLHKILYTVRNTSIKGKLFLTYLFATCITMFLLFFILKAAIGKQLFTHEQSLLDSSLQQSITQLESQVNDVINLSNIIYNNDTLLSACNEDYKDNYFKMYMSYNNEILPDLYVYRCLIPEVTDIKIYSDCGIHPYKNSVEDIADLKEMPWFEKIQNNHLPQWVADYEAADPIIASLRKFPQNYIYPYENYLYLAIDYHDFFSCTTSICPNSYGIVITDFDGTPLYQYNSPSSGMNPVIVEEITRNYEDSVQKYKNKYLFLSRQMSSVNWTVYFYSPINSIKQTVEQTISTVFLMLALCFSLLFILTFLMVNSIFSPLSQLKRVIENISLEDMGRHEIIIIPNRRDEIGILIQAFNTMLKRISSLIDEVYVQKLKTREYQLNALRAQINPHFLYNTLSLINARAIISGQEEISETVRLLTIFYRTSLNNGHDLTSLGNELNNIQAYISIQLILTAHSFRVIYDLDETLTEMTIPSLILQPIVENAIEHGLRNCHNPVKELRITTSKDSGNCYIQICDNGAGITPDKKEILFSQETNHIGIKNVNERLILSYGEGHGLKVDSNPGEGTTITIKIPL